MGAATVTTVVDLVRARAQQDPGGIAYRVLRSGGRPPDVLTYAELDARSRAAAAELASYGARGERVLLMAPLGVEWIAAFFGCLYAGAIAVPLPPYTSKRASGRLTAVARDCAPKMALVGASAIAALQEHLGPAMAHCCDVATLGSRGDAHWSPPDVSPSSVALIQYTSGSTDTPKGVIVSHDNILHTSGRMNVAFRYSQASVCVSWLPLFHDMGLIGGLVQPLHGGFPCALMDPAAFVKRPAAWLEAISTLQATISGGPNFAYDLCVRRITDAERATLDLTSWDVAFNGSESVRPDTLERFATAFAPCGFRKAAFYPCYGLAEATLFVSGGKVEATAQPRVIRIASPDDPGPEPIGRRRVASCGTVGDDLDVRVVDPSTLVPCRDGAIGEIWVSGRSVALGYWNQPAATAATFEASPVGSPNGRHYLRTGDLGFMVDGEVCITGRVKDVMVIRGQNYHPEDVEAVVQQSDELLIPSGGAVVAIDGSAGEECVVIQEVERGHSEDLAPIADRIRAAVAAQCRLAVSDVLLVKPGTIPRTSSGKVRRSQCREAFVNNQIPTLWRDRIAPPDDGSGETSRAPAPRDDRSANAGLCEYVRECVASCLQRPARAIAIDRPLASYGLDSLVAAQVSGRFEADLGVELPASVILDHATVERLAAELQQRLRTAAAPSDEPMLQAGSAGGRFPATGPQQRVWALAMLTGAQPVIYQLAGLLTLRGAVDVATLERALNDIVRRHEVLRSRFVVEQRLMQIVDAPVWRPLARLPIGDANVGSARETVRSLARAEARRPIGYTSGGGLVRWRLWEVAENELALLVVVPHIVSDGASAAIFVRELVALYDAYRAGRESPLPPLGIQFGDYALWSEARLQSSKIAGDLDYWTMQLRGIQPLLLPGRRARTAMPAYRGERCESVVDAVSARRMRAVAENAGATPYIVLLAAFYVLLHRWTDQTDIVVGVPTANRPRRELESVIGCFADALAVRTSLAGDPTFADLINRVREVALDAFAHSGAEYHQVRLRHAAETEGWGSLPLFQTTFLMRESPVAGVAADGLQLAWEELHDGTAWADLSVALWRESDGRLRASWDFDTELFDRAVVERLAASYQQLVHDLGLEPQKAISSFSILGRLDADRLAAWNDTERDSGVARSIVEELEARAASTPDAIALCDEHGQLSYGALNRRANQIARWLGTHGVSGDRPVALCMPRSAQSVAAMLGIVKAGAPFVPLDPSYPDDRIGFMLRDSGAAVLVGNEPPRTGPRDTTLVNLDAVASELDALPDTNPPIATHPDSVLYVMYTSGSSGVPKGVLGTHRAALNRFRWMWRSFAFAADDVICQKTSLSFVDSVWECLGGLLGGARTVVASDAVVGDLNGFVDFLARHRVSRVTCVPSYLESLLDHAADPSRRLSLVRQWISSGESLSTGLLARLQSALPSAQIVNLYGSSEVAADALCHVCASAADVSTVPIGRPIDNTRAYVLDAQLRPVPIGIRGEIHIAGDNVARGYLDRPELTARRFLPDPFARNAGQRMYATGDIGCYQSDGAIEFVGRKDLQVKVRGCRVELEEIEAALASHPHVDRAVVRVDGDVLIAHVLPTAGHTVVAEPLREYLYERLPAFMVPSTFIGVIALPLLPNGKIDRAAIVTASLPAPPAAGAIETEPGTALESALLRIWMEVLRKDQIRVTDNFFDIGGHSLALLEVRARLEQVVPRPVAPRELFEYPTIQALCRHLASRNGDDDVVAKARHRAVASRQRRSRTRSVRPQPAKA